MTWDEKMDKDRSGGHCVTSCAGGGRGSLEELLEVMSKGEESEAVGGGS